MNWHSIHYQLEAWRKKLIKGSWPWQVTINLKAPKHPSGKECMTCLWNFSGTTLNLCCMCLCSKANWGGKKNSASRHSCAFILHTGNYPRKQRLGPGPNGLVQRGHKVDERWHQPAALWGRVCVRPVSRGCRMGPQELQTSGLQAQSAVRDDARHQDVRWK